MNAKTVPFGSIAEFRNGINYVAADIGDVVKVIGVGDFRDRSRLDKFSDLSTVMINGSLAADDELRDGDLLLVRSNGSRDLVGRSLIIKGPPPGVTFSGFTIRVRVEPSVALPEFVALVLQGSAIKNHLLLAGGGNGNIANLSQSLLRDIELPLPPVNAQRAILGVVSTWDLAIEKTERLLAAKERSSEALAYMLLFSRRSTTHWDAVEIGDIAQEVSSTSPSTDDLPVLSCTKHQGLVESLKYFDKQVYSQDTSKYKVVLSGQFVYATNHIEEGSIGLQNIVSAGLVSPMYTVFKADEDLVDAGYLFKVLKTERLRQVFAAKTNASVDRRGSLRWNAFARIQLRLPPVEEQREIRCVLDDAKHECNLLRASAAALRLQKRGLMQKLLTGERHVPVPASETT